jgi:hypothetical protein
MKSQDVDICDRYIGRLYVGTPINLIYSLALISLIPSSQKHGVIFVDFSFAGLLRFPNS